MHLKAGKVGACSLATEQKRVVWGKGYLGTLHASTYTCKCTRKAKQHWTEVRWAGGIPRCWGEMGDFPIADGGAWWRNLSVGGGMMGILSMAAQVSELGENLPGSHGDS